MKLSKIKEEVLEKLWGGWILEKKREGNATTYELFCPIQGMGDGKHPSVFIKQETFYSLLHMDHFIEGEHGENGGVGYYQLTEKGREAISKETVSETRA